MFIGNHQMWGMQTPDSFIGLLSFTWCVNKFWMLPQGGNLSDTYVLLSPLEVDRPWRISLLLLLGTL